MPARVGNRGQLPGISGRAPGELPGVLPPKSFVFGETPSLPPGYLKPFTTEYTEGTEGIW